jgi:DNA-binding HxlR family transcriptional regulator
MTEFLRSACPVAYALDRFGDRWSLLVVRHAFVGARRFGDFQRMPEAIPTNILTDRLKRLVAEGIFSREPYQRRPLRYEYRLTPKGAGLLPVLQALTAWSRRHEPETWEPPEWFTAASPEDFGGDPAKN